MPHDVSVDEAKAQSGNGLRVAVEARHKPLHLCRGYLTLALVSRPILLTVKHPSPGTGRACRSTALPAEHLRGKLQD